METTIRQALAKTSTPPQDNTTTEIIRTITTFIEAYGIYLKRGTLLKFKIIFQSNPTGGVNFTLKPPSPDYGNFRAEYLDANNPFGQEAIINLLQNHGAKVTRYEADDEFIIEFVVT